MQSFPVCHGERCSFHLDFEVICPALEYHHSTLNHFHTFAVHFPQHSHHPSNSIFRGSNVQLKFHHYARHCATSAPELNGNSRRLCIIPHTAAQISNRWMPLRQKLRYGEVAARLLTCWFESTPSSNLRASLLEDGLCFLFFFFSFWAAERKSVQTQAGPRSAIERRDVAGGRRAVEDDRYLEPSIRLVWAHHTGHVYLPAWTCL